MTLNLDVNEKRFAGNIGSDNEGDKSTDVTIYVIGDIEISLKALK